MGDVGRFFEKITINPVQVWEDWKEQNKEKSTPKNYQIGLNYFLEFNEIEDLNELYQIQLEAEKRGQTNPLEKYVIQKMIDKTVSWMTDDLDFSGAFNATLEKGTRQKGSKGGSDIISPENLKVVVDLADDLQKKALILVLKDSGLRIGDVLDLTYEDVSEAIESNVEFYQLDKLTRKTKNRAQTVLGYESLNALRVMIKQKKQIAQINPKTPLFSTYRLRGKDSPKAKKKRTEEDRKEFEENLRIRMQTPISRVSGSGLVSRLFSKAGFPKVTANGLRKLHSSYLELENGISEPMIARMEGRVIPDSREAYKKYPKEELIEAYSKNYDMILVNKNHVKHVERLEKTIEEMKEEMRKELDNVMEFTMNMDWKEIEKLQKENIELKRKLMKHEIGFPPDEKS
jgi:integrase